MTTGPGAIQLPPGVTLAASRETSQVAANGQIEQGIAFTLRLPAGTNTTIFVPYSLLGQTGAIASAFNERIEQLQAIQNLANPL